MRERRHHNNTGERQVRRGRTADQVKHMAERLGVKFRAYKHGLKPVIELPSTKPPVEPRMMRRECEVAIRALSRIWALSSNTSGREGEEPGFSDFLAWLRGKGYGRYLEFRATTAAENEARVWFEDELEAVCASTDRPG